MTRTRRPDDSARVVEVAVRPAVGGARHVLGVPGGDDVEIEPGGRDAFKDARATADAGAEREDVQPKLVDESGGEILVDRRDTAGPFWVRRLEDRAVTAADLRPMTPRTDPQTRRAGGVEPADP